MAIEIVTYFDSKQTDDLNNQLLLFELNHFKCHVIEMALTGECKDFIASDTPQKLFSIFWTNAIVFSPQQIIYYKEFTFFQVILILTEIRILNEIYFYEILESCKLYYIWIDCSLLSIY